MSWVSVMWIYHVLLPIHQFTGSWDFSFWLFKSNNYNKNPCTRFCVDITFSVLWSVYLGMKFLGHRVSPCLTFSKTAKQFNFFGGNCWSCFSFLHSNQQHISYILINTRHLTFWLLYYHSGGCEVVSYSDFGLHSMMV